MKTQCLIAAAAAAFLFASCGGDYEIVPEKPQEGKVTLDISLGGPLTKSEVPASSGSDMMFHDAQIFIYNKDGKLETKSGKVTSQNGIKLSIIPGHKTLWAVVNAPELDIAEGSSETPELMRTDLSDNTLTSLVMSGTKEVDVKNTTAVSIEVKHVACKIILDRVTREFTNTDYSEVPMTLKKIFMSNVVAECDYGCTGFVPEKWNCKLGVLSNPAENAALLVDDNLAGDLSEGKSYSVPHTYYVYPNPTATDSDGQQWSPRKTRLVLQCDYNGRTCYYPVTIRADKLERNKVYHITALTLKRPGSTSPENKDLEVSSDVDCTFSITVTNWQIETPYSEEF